MLQEIRMRLQAREQRQHCPKRYHAWREAQSLLPRHYRSGGSLGAVRGPGPGPRGLSVRSRRFCRVIPARPRRTGGGTGGRAGQGLAAEENDGGPPVRSCRVVLVTTNLWLATL